MPQNEATAVPSPRVRTARKRDDAKRIDSSVTAKILTLANLLRRSGNLRYRREFGLSLTELRILSHVGASTRLSLNQIAAHAGLDKTQMSREVKSLVSRGLIARKANQRNLAEAEISLTEHGRKLYAGLTKSAGQRTTELVDSFNEAEIELLAWFLNRLSDRAREILRKEQVTTLEARNGKGK
jgi:DNA-binding MarR family transcriptional regulator